MTNESEFYDSEPNLQWANASISDVPRDQLRMQLEFYQESLIKPPGRGPMLRDGPALATPARGGETDPNDRRTAPSNLREGQS